MSDKLEQFRILFNNVLDGCIMQTSSRAISITQFDEKCVVITKTTQYEIENIKTQLVIIRKDSDSKLHYSSFHSTTPRGIYILVGLCINYLNKNGTYTDHKFITLLHDCRLRFSTFEHDFRDLSMSLFIGTKKYTWAFSYWKTVEEWPLITSETPSIVNEISQFCAKYNYDLKMSRNISRKMSKEVPQTITTTTEKTRTERIDDAIEQAIYDMFKIQPLDVDAIAKLRSLLK